MYAKLSTAKTVMFGPVLDTAGAPYTGAIAYTDARIFKNGTDGALDASATFTHKYEGVYALALTANDISAVGVAEVVLNLANYSAAPVKLDVLPALVHDSLVGGTDNLQVDAIQWLGVAPLALSSQRVQVDATAINGSTLAAEVLAARHYGYQDDAVAVVADGATDAARGTNLATAYTTAKALTPGGAALSKTNRAAVLIPKAHYNLAATLDLDTEFVDLIALEPEMGGPRQPTDHDPLTSESTGFRPPPTLVYSSTLNGTSHIIDQQANDVRFKGFGVASLTGTTPGAYSAFFVSATAADPSQYDMMYFWHSRANGSRYPVGFALDVRGTWTRCIANGYAWRVGWDGLDASQFIATMYDCEGGASSFMGDYAVYETLGTHQAANSLLVRCSCIGTQETGAGTSDSGWGGFAGCNYFGIPIASTVLMIDCLAGSNSFGLGNANAGTHIRCTGGDYSFGSTTSGCPGEFSGKAYDCIGGLASFGGNGDASYPGKLSGTIINCKSEGSQLPWRVEGATIEDSLLTVTANNVDGITLLDSASKIHNSTILVVEGGTGIPINAASALNVSAVGNRYNNVGATATGLGSNVTNKGTVKPFVPSLDVVANVTLVDTTTTNTDMRGTDSVPTNPLLTDDVRIPATAPPTNTQFEARTKVAADYADKTTLDVIATDVAGLDGAAMLTAAEITAIQVTTSQTNIVTED